MNSLREAYTLAHTAQCRLNIEAGRKDRNMRFLVGHLMHYESLRLRIVEIEHDISKSARASAVQFKGTGHVDHRLQHKPSTGQLGRKSPPPPPPEYDDDDEDDLDDFLDDEEEDTEGLSLERFPSGSVRQSQPPPPELEPDNPDEDDDDDFDEPISPDDETLAECVKGDGDELMATMYEGVRKCVCHGKTDAPSFTRMWELPPDKNNSKPGITRAVAEVRDDDDKPSAQIDCTKSVSVAA
ncbi:hypothetical protein PRZ48_011714 [Zasmidium cellare]|uniref:Uncharacterized protein n=1 Tax=Zasmidium cellare TaxID=395010 RepID=A0ABR0E7G7_ZASCE|nr:hypothetical protein PRZ48_011714 [Zasmidium cellare]